MERILVCVAWPYADGPVHLGHIMGAYLPADIFKRYHKMIGNEVLMVSGSDEHGTPITIQAEKENVHPSVISEKYHRINEEIFNKMNIDFDIYSRTSSDEHKRIVKDFLLKIYENGYIYENTMISPFCPNCKRFLPDRYVEGTCPYCGYPKARGDQCENCGRTLDPQELINPHCRICGATPEFKETKHLFFKLSELEKPLNEWVKSNTHWRDNVKNYTQKFIEGGLKDRPITRDLDWGVEVPFPGYENKRIYVWFEAVIGYLSATIAYSKKINNENLWELYWKDKNTKHYYFIGKDNIPFHTIIWPGMLMAHGDLNLPYDVPANEYLILKGMKFSKSAAHGIFMPEMLKLYDPDMIRFYASMNLPENHDTEFSWNDFYNIVNSELIDKYANFVHRVLKFVYNKYKSVPPALEFDDNDYDAIKMITKTGEEMSKFLSKVEIKNAIKSFMNLVYYGNYYFDKFAPWDLCKKDEKKCQTKLHISLMIVKALAIYGYPFIPSTSKKVWNMLGYIDPIEKYGWVEAINPMEPNNIKEPVILFKKLEIKEEYEFKDLDIRVGKIIEIKDHPNADKLYLLKVKVGEDIRNIVAGLKKYYSKDELLNRNIIILYNLEEAKIREEISSGMLLAADDGNNVSILVPENAEDGEKVLFNNIETNPNKKINIKEFQKVRIEIGKIKEIENEYAIVESKITYKIKSDLLNNKVNEYVVLVFSNNKPYLMHTKNGIIKPLKDVSPGARIR